MNSKEVKKARKTIRLLFNDLITEGQKMGFIDRLIISKEIIFRTKRSNSKLNVVNK